MKRLIYGPMIHNPWSIAEYSPYYIEYCIGQNPDRTLINIFRDNLNRYWDRIDALLASKKIYKIYHDSYSEMFKLEDIVKQYRKGADKSRDFAAVCSLLDKGAKLMVTESEAAMTKWRACTSETPVVSTRNEVSRQLVVRDNYIAMNINNTLQKNETGVLLMGYAHKVDKIITKKYPNIHVESVNEKFAGLINICKVLSLNHINDMKCINSEKVMSQSYLSRLEPLLK